MRKLNKAGVLHIMSMLIGVGMMSAGRRDHKRDLTDGDHERLKKAQERRDRKAAKAAKDAKAAKVRANLCAR